MPAPAAAPIASDTTTVAAEMPASTVRNRRAAASNTLLPGDGRVLRADLFRRHRPALERVEACGRVSVPEREERRLLDVAVAWMEARAARMEPAARRRVDRIRHVTL